MSDESLNNLINGWLDGSLNSESRAELEAILLHDTAAREKFWQLAAFHGLVHDVAKQKWGVSELWRLYETSEDIVGGATDPYSVRSSSHPENRHGSSARRVTNGMALRRLSFKLAGPSLAIIGCFWAFLSYLIFFHRNDYPSRPIGGSTVPVAMLVSEKDCVWQADSRGRLPYVGQQLKTGETVVLRSGIAEITFADGAWVAIKGPANLEFLASGKGSLRSGQLAAHVPPQAVGFEIETPTTRVVDLGTDFRLAVDPAVTQFAVTAGKTDLFALNVAADGSKRAASSSRRLVAGQAVAVTTTNSGDTSVRETKFDPNWLSEIAPTTSPDQPSSAIVAYQNIDGASGNESTFHGGVGLDFEVRAPIRIYSLGVFDHLGDGIDPSTSPIVQLWSRDTRGTPNDTRDDVSNKILATQDFTATDSGQLKLGHRFKSLPNPIELPVGSYTIVTYGLCEANPFLSFGSLDFSANPHWSGLNNTTNGNNYGWSGLTNQAGGFSSKVGGVFARSKAASFYGDTNLSQKFSLDNPIVASGKFNIRDVTKGWSGHGRSGFFIGHFSTNSANLEFIGLEFKESHVDADIGNVDMQARLQVRRTNGLGGEHSDWIKVSTDKDHTFSYAYDPNLGSDGRFTVYIDDQTVTTINVTDGQRRFGVQFDSFGIGFSNQMNSEDAPKKTAEVYIDDVNYSGLQTITSSTGNEPFESAKLRIETARGSIGPVGSRSGQAKPGEFPQMSDRLIGYAAGTFEYLPLQEKQLTK